MNQRPIRAYSLCPACTECPTVEVYQTGEVHIGEGSNLATLTRAEWNQLVRAIRSGELGELTESTEME
jgi:sarcosine oxidase delta subunit